MTGNDKIFTALMTCSLLLLSAIMTQNAISACHPGPRQTIGVADSPESITFTPEQTQALKEKFTKMGLPLHEGKYWITP